MDDLAAQFWWAFPAFFAGLWLAIFFVVSRWGGWRLLARAYPARGPATGERFRMRSLQLRAWCNYNNCVTLVSGPVGLELSLPAPFRFFHPAVFVPWGELEARRERVWPTRAVVLRTFRCPEVPIKLRPSLAESLIRAGGSQLTVADESEAALPRGR